MQNTQSSTDTPCTFPNNRHCVCRRCSFANGVYAFEQRVLSDNGGEYPNAEELSVIGVR